MSIVCVFLFADSKWCSRSLPSWAHLQVAINFYSVFCYQLSCINFPSLDTYLHIEADMFYVVHF